MVRRFALFFVFPARLSRSRKPLPPARLPREHQLSIQLSRSGRARQTARRRRLCFLRCRKYGSPGDNVNTEVFAGLRFSIRTRVSRDSGFLRALMSEIPIPDWNRTCGFRHVEKICPGLAKLARKKAVRGDQTRRSTSRTVRQMNFQGMLRRRGSGFQN